MWSSGTSIDASTWGATLCIRLVQIATVPAPPATQARAAATSRSPAPAQSPSTWHCRTAAKSSDCKEIGAEA